MEGNAAWDDLRVLLALHRHRSFLAAGKALGMSTSTTARRIDALEASLGRAVVRRSSGGTVVEADALELVALAEQLELGLRAVRRDEGEEALTGVVRLSMAEGFVRPVMQVLCDVQRAHPGIVLEVVSEYRVVDLARREADIGIRSGRTKSPSVVERSVGSARLSLYASRSYVERRVHGAKLRREDYARLEFIGNDERSGHPQQDWLLRQGAKRFVLRSNSEAAILEAVLQGQGIAVLGQPVVRGLDLVRLDAEEEPPAIPIYLAYHRELRGVPRVRLVLAALDAAVREGLR